MGIAGSLAFLGLSDLLTIFAMRLTTGRLTVERGRDDAVLYFERGQLVHVSSSQVAKRLGELLVQQGRLTEAQLARALESQRAAGGSVALGAILVQQRIITPAELETTLTHQAEQILYRVLAWPDGYFVYVPEPLDVSSVPLPQLNFERIILEAFRLADEQAIRSAAAVPGQAADQPAWAPSASETRAPHQEWKLIRVGNTAPLVPRQG